MFAQLALLFMIPQYMLMIYSAYNHQHPTVDALTVSWTLCLANQETKEYLMFIELVV